MRSTFWQNRIFEHQSCQFVTLAWNSLQNGQTVRFSWKLYKTLFSGHAQHVLAKSNLWASNFSKSLPLSQILFKTGKQCAFLENCTKRSFQVMRSTFWQNRICESESCQNRHTGLKFSPKRGNSALFMKIVGHAQHVLAKSHFWAPKLSIRHTGLKFSSKRPNSALFMKIVQNALFRSCAARFGQIAFVSVKVVKTVRWPQILSKEGKQCAFHENCTKRSFQVMRSTFWPNQICERQGSQNRHTGLKFSSKRENRARFLKIVQDARVSFGQIAFVRVKVVKVVTLATPKRGNSALFMKIVQIPIFRSCAARFGKIAFLSTKVVNSSHWPEILSKEAKQCAFH